MLLSGAPILVPVHLQDLTTMKSSVGRPRRIPLLAIRLPRLRLWKNGPRLCFREKALLRDIGVLRWLHSVAKIDFHILSLG
jgi:hypothetical protein